MRGETIGELYGLQYDDQPYGLPIWYNKLIDKTIDQIDLRDVFSMISNKILLELAIAKAIEFFVKNPFDGEAYSGQLLELFVNNSDMFYNSKSSKLAEMLKIIDKMDIEAAQSKDWWGYDFDFDEEGCKNYVNLLDKAKSIIKKHDT